MTATPTNADIDRNRRMVKWTRRQLAGRLAWAITAPFFRFSPRPLWGWRRLLLRGFGAKVGQGAHVYPSVRISVPWNVSIGDRAAVGDRVILYALGPISIGARATISQGSHLCAGTHDHRDPAMPLLKLPISIADDVWVCADAFIGPGVKIGACSVVGARAVVMRDVEPGAIMAGNPARKVGVR
jgi:putative colanic acid biosynthesis acetyltransferase WcaF